MWKQVKSLQDKFDELFADFNKFTNCHFFPSGHDL